MDNYLTLWLLVMCCWSAEGRKSPEPGRCSYSKVYNMAGADCSGINLVNIPTSLRNNIEVLEASGNRIRALTNSSFKGLTYLRYLYLADNSISLIETGTFLEVPDLEVLDLSLNAIRKIPPLLPSKLRKLYLAENPLMEVTTIPLDQATGLQFLTLAHSYLFEMPRLGELPNLQELNLTGNPLRTLNVSSLASFCNLQVLTLPTTLMEAPYTSTCDCLRVRYWTMEHMIVINPSIFNCTIDENECELNTTEEAEVFAMCQVAYQKQAATHYLVIVAAALGFLFCATVCTVICSQRFKRGSTPVQNAADGPNGRQSKLLPDSQTKSRF